MLKGVSAVATVNVTYPPAVYSDYNPETGAGAGRADAATGGGGGGSGTGGGSTNGNESGYGTGGIGYAEGVDYAVVPPGYPDDSFMVGLTSGEGVSVTTDGSKPGEG